MHRTPKTKIFCEPNIHYETELSNINFYLYAVLSFWLATTRPIFLPEELYDKKVPCINLTIFLKFLPVFIKNDSCNKHKKVSFTGSFVADITWQPGGDFINYLIASSFPFFSSTELLRSWIYHPKRRSTDPLHPLFLNLIYLLPNSAWSCRPHLHRLHLVY